ncbi:hypothetical protein C2G38_2086336, partial [Gigaspora rosea]
IQVCGGLQPPIHDNTAMCYIDWIRKNDQLQKNFTKFLLNGKITKPFYQNYWNQIKNYKI